jgi:hypothetical protein
MVRPRMEIWVLEWSHWYEGGSVLEAYAEESKARAKLQSEIRNKRRWKKWDNKDCATAVETWARAEGHQRIVLHRLTLKV